MNNIENIDTNKYYLYSCRVLHNSSINLYYSSVKFDFNFKQLVKIDSKHGLDIAEFLYLEKETNLEEINKILNQSNHNKIESEIDETTLSTTDNIDFNLLEKNETMVLNETDPLNYMKIDGTILGIPTEDDLKKYEFYKKRSKESFEIFKKEILKFNLKMKPITAHQFLDDKKVIFYFISDGRVDFRELVKSLAAIFKKRIELHQIGVRDEARYIGGIGICGRELCCKSFLNVLKPISIKMAKIQNAPLNTLKISGYCGRLLCCLSYEYENYKQIKDNYPEEGSIVIFEGKNYILYEINIIKKSIKLKDETNNFIKISLENFNYIKDNVGNIIITNYKTMW